MSIYKRGDAYYVYLTIRGRKIRQSAGKGATKRQARELERKIQADIHAQKIGHQPSRPLSDALLRYLDSEVPGLKSATGIYSHARCVAPYVKGRTLDEIVDVAEEMKKDMQTRQLAPATIYQRVAILRRIANLAHDSWRWLDKPLGRAIKPPSVNNERHIYLTPRQVDRFADVCGDAEAAKCILLAAYTGLRRGEIFQLTEAQYRDGVIRLDAKTKTAKPRTVPVPEGVRWCCDDLPLRVTANSLRIAWERARRELAMPNVHFHDLRHSYASWLVQTGADLLTVQRLLGHSTPTMTNRYAHLSQQHLEETVVNMAALVRRKVS